MVADMVCDNIGMVPTGCGDLTYNITTGLPNVNGARYVLNVGFKEGIALLQNETETSIQAQ